LAAACSAVASARSYFSSFQASLIPAAPEKAEHSYPKVLSEETFEIYQGYPYQLVATATSESTFQFGFGGMGNIIEYTLGEVYRIRTVLREKLAPKSSHQLYMLFFTVDGQDIAQFNFFDRYKAVAAQAILEEKLEKIYSSISSFVASMNPIRPAVAAVVKETPAEKDAAPCSAVASARSCFSSFQDSLNSKILETYHSGWVAAGPSDTQVAPTLACPSSTHKSKYEDMQFSYDERTRIMTAVYVSKRIPAAKNDSLPQVDIKGDTICATVNSTTLSLRHVCTHGQQVIPFAQWINAWLIELYTAGAFE